MSNIAIICEGISECNVIKHIITRYSGPHFFNVIQPQLTPDASKQDGFGGWQQVLEHCNDDTFDRIFQYNDFLVIQIDTDTSHQTPYDVMPYHPGGSPKSPARLLTEIKVRLMRDIQRNKRRQYLPKIIFAICHNEIECWLLPVFYTDHNACRTNNCIHTLNQALDKQDIYRIPDKDKNCHNAQVSYRTILKKLRNRASIDKCAQHSISFTLFTKGLEIIPIIDD